MAQRFMLAPRREAPRVEKKSTKILKIYILALRVPGASLQAQRGDIAHVGTVHTWGQCTAGDIAHVGQCTRGDIAHVGTVRTWEQRREVLRWIFF